VTIAGQAKVGQVAARLVGRLARKCGKDESARVEAVDLITAVRHGEGERLILHYDTSSGQALGEGRALLRHADTLISRDSTRAPRPTEEAS
jgi:hypothetical protein